MQTQEIWFDQSGQWPSHGCITDSAPGYPLAVIDYATGQVVTPETHPTLHTILDPGQAIPQLMTEAKALGYTVTYHLHGDDMHAVQGL